MKVLLQKILVNIVPGTACSDHTCLHYIMFLDAGTLTTRHKQFVALVFPNQKHLGGH